MDVLMEIHWPKENNFLLTRKSLQIIPASMMYLIDFMVTPLWNRAC
jgi:hypothetical protein